ncbi:hypothetical protein ACFELO_03065 [Oceanicaulis sp. LC35]|uniref:hypothetical protein n=1 Tax=Oceanicaulis sp. LC35 TaxID=3349635 RepID=UPI003F8754A7
MVNTVGTQGPYLGPNGANAATQGETAKARSGASNQNPASKSASDTVSLSAAARAVLNGSSARVDALMAERGDAIFRNALAGARAYQDNYASVLEKPDLDADTARETRMKMLAREREAFTSPEHTGDVLTRARAYIEFFDSLSEEEQNSERYRGTRETMAAIVEQESVNAGVEAPDLSLSQSPFDALLNALSDGEGGIAQRNSQDVVDEFRARLETQVGSEARQREGRELENRYIAVQDLVERARRGDEAAYARLEALSENQSAIAPVSESGTDE